MDFVCRTKGGAIGTPGAAKAAMGGKADDLARIGQIALPLTPGRAGGPAASVSGFLGFL